ncbi:MAG: helix-turn-helix transcriptional regulator [Clostridia bacterium]|nr:helix-turn-helix transcriptional regulator [Clostridia bacterium]
MSTISERIAACIKESGLTKTAFAEKLGVTQPFVSKLCKGISVPSDRTIRDIADKFNIDETWLRTGEGEMLKPQSLDDELTEFFASLSFGGDSFKKRLISVMSRLDEDDWKTLEKLALELAEK